jgi:hypothetical protein
MHEDVGEKLDEIKMFRSRKVKAQPLYQINTSPRQNKARNPAKSTYYDQIFSNEGDRAKES